MRNRILLTLALLLILMIIFVRYEFSRGLEKFSNEIFIQEQKQMFIFQKAKTKMITSLEGKNKKLFNLYNKEFNEREAIVESDTSYSYFYLSKTMKYRPHEIEYINCLLDKCKIIMENEVSDRLSKAKETALSSRYGELFLLWYPKLKDKYLYKGDTCFDQCTLFFDTLIKYSFRSSAWIDFERLLETYRKEKASIEKGNDELNKDYKLIVSNIRNALNENALNYFDTKISEMSSTILTSELIKRTFICNSFGPATYSFKRIVFNRDALRSIAEQSFEEQWKTNSLSTGSTPYSNCYGSNGFCSDYSCSEIKVITGGDGDVIVIVKDAAARVVRHIYIQGGDSYKFSVPNGSYQVFFYSGKGWNPDKSMPSSECASLEGGFVSREEVTKDNYFSLYSQSMTYELRLQEDGNFSTKPSSKEEAF